MKLIHTALGELYQSFSAEELKELDIYLKRQVLNPNNTLMRLHRLYRESKLGKQLDKLDTDDIKTELFDTTSKGVSKHTTYTNFLLQHIKEFLILSKIKDKNIYSETLWGEILIEKGLKKNLLLKVTNFKIEIYKESYAFMKIFFHKRERFFYDYLTLRKQSYKSMLISQNNQILAFKNYTDVYYMELIASLASLSQQINVKVDIPQANELISNFKNSDDTLVRLQARSLSLAINNDKESFFDMMNIFERNYSIFSIERLVQLVPNLLNYCLIQTYKGNEDFELENHKLFCSIYEKNILFSPGISNNIRLFNCIRLELRYGSIENAKQILNESLKVIPTNQKESFENLIASRIEFAQKDYKNALYKISKVDPKDSIYYYPQYKIMSLMSLAMLNEYDRLVQERETFYKYVHNNKNIPEDAQRRHKLFIKYVEYLVESRYEYLSGYMRQRIENALLPTSPYFTEKGWVRERWNELKEKFNG